MYSSLRSSFSFLLKCVDKKYPESKQIVSSVFFLRFICPTIISPASYGLEFEDQPAAAAADGVHRGLVNLSKILQNFANGFELKDKSYADLVNVGIKTQHPLIIAFIDQLVVSFLR